MSEGQPSRAAELAASQVESIVSAAQAAAEEIKKGARAEVQGARRDAQREADAILDEARHEAAKEVDTGRKQALLLGQDARKEAQALVEEARKESAQVREQTRRAVEGRVAAAEEAAAQVLEEARVLSSGLRRLGEALGEQGERILRDVQAAHRRMQADLRVSPSDGDLPTEPLPGRSDRPSGPARPGPAPRPSAGRERRNPLEDLEVPSWVGRER